MNAIRERVYAPSRVRAHVLSRWRSGRGTLGLPSEACHKSQLRRVHVGARARRWDDGRVPGLFIVSRYRRRRHRRWSVVTIGSSASRNWWTTRCTLSRTNVCGAGSGTDTSTRSALRRAVSRYHLVHVSVLSQNGSHVNRRAGASE